jgi:hypothetical protein
MNQTCRSGSEPNSGIGKACVRRILGRLACNAPYLPNFDLPAVGVLTVALVSHSSRYYKYHILSLIHTSFLYYPF